jgi:hypothetical protein
VNPGTAYTQAKEVNSMNIGEEFSNRIIRSQEELILTTLLILYVIVSAIAHQ